MTCLQCAAPISRVRCSKKLCSAKCRVTFNRQCQRQRATQGCKFHAVHIGGIARCTVAMPCRLPQRYRHPRVDCRPALRHAL